MNTQELVKGLLIAIAASSLTLGGHHVLADPAVPRVVTPGASGGGSDAAVERTLARLEDLFRGQSSQLVGGTRIVEASSARQVVAGSPSVPTEGQEILERLATIERKLSVRPAIVRELQPLNRLRAPDILAIRAAIELREVDREACEFDLHMRTMHEMVERFGYPNEIEPCSGNFEVYWRYELPSADPENPNYLCVYFQAGRVTMTESRWTD